MGVSFKRYYGFLRALLMVMGLALVAAGVDTVASLPSGPPADDGFLDGLAYLAALVLGSAGLVVIQLGFALPPGVGRFRGGPLADRTAGARSGAVVVAYVVALALGVYVIPVFVPSVTGSPAYVTLVVCSVIATVVGVAVTLVVTIGGVLYRIHRRRSLGS